MRSFIVVAAVLQVVLGGGSQVAVRQAFLNPAGVTYLSGPAPAGLAAGPALGYAGGLGLAHGIAPAPVGFAGPVGLAAHGYAAGPVGLAAPGYAAGPVGLAAPGYAAGPVGFAGPVGLAAPGYAAGHVGLAHGYAAPALGYAHAKVPALQAVPTVHHVPGVADVPVTSIHAQPGVVQKLVDVAHPAVSTRKFEVRRPAIQKQFYDIEERVVVRPAGSALVELEQPLSKVQRGPAVINPVGAVAAAPIGFGPAPIAAGPIGFGPAHIAAAPVAVTPSPVFISSTPAPAFGGFGPSGPAAGAPAQFESDGDSLVVENPEFSARSGPSQAQQELAAEQQQLDAQQAELQSRQQQLANARAQLAQPIPSPSPSPVPHGLPAVNVRSNGAPLASLVPAPRGGPAVVPSLRNLNPVENQANQQRLLQLLTEQGGVAEVGFGRAGPAPGPVGDAGFVRARVLSATPAPAYAEPAGERVSTRRVVVSRPIETLQEIDVVEPVTKLHRVAVNQPTLFKTLRHDIARVPTSVPVYGKALQPTFAHAAVPVGYYPH